jgi:hypothetical protein
MERPVSIGFVLEVSEGLNKNVWHLRVESSTGYLVLGWGYRIGWDYKEGLA